MYVLVICGPRHPWGGAEPGMPMPGWLQRIKPVPFVNTSHLPVSLDKWKGDGIQLWPLGLKGVSGFLFSLSVSWWGYRRSWGIYPGVSFWFWLILLLWALPFFFFLFPFPRIYPGRPVLVIDENTHSYHFILLVNSWQSFTCKWKI